MKEKTRYFFRRQYRWLADAIDECLFRIAWKIYDMLPSRMKAQLEKKPCKDSGTGPASPEPYTLVGKTRPFTSPNIQASPPSSLSGKPKEKSDNFASDENRTKDTDTPDEGDNELDVERPADETDADEVLREEMLLTDSPEVSPSAILARDLLRMRGWNKDRDLDGSEGQGAAETLGKLAGTDLMEKYKAHLLDQEGSQRQLLALIRQAEEGTPPENNAREEAPPTSPGAEEDKPLAYYL